MKYDRIGAFLVGTGAEEVPMTFSEIERLIGSPLPPSARKHRPWWSNNGSNSAMTQVWLKAGYRTERVDMGGERLVFRRMTSPAHTALPADPASPLADLYGCMEGTVRFLPDVDLCAPTGEVWRAVSE